jgi:hypothetical protein
MPLLANAPELVRHNLDQIRIGNRVKLIVIGRLSVTQLADINSIRLALAFRPIIAEIVFIGMHIYRSRIAGDGYTIEDVVEQISSALDSNAVVFDTPRMTALENPHSRMDRYGNLVKDRAILECTARYPRPELYSVIPKGDIVKPRK